MSVDDDRAAITSATTALLEAVNRGDVEGVLSVWAEDGEMLPPDHWPVRGLAALRAYFQSLFGRAMFQFTFPEQRLEILGDVGLERVSYTSQVWLAGSAPLSGSGKGLHVYRRQADGTWKLAYDIWNSDGVSEDS